MISSACHHSPAPAKLTDEKKPLKEFRVVGYVFTRADWDDVIDKIPWDRLTAINLAFVHPEVSGKFIDKRNVQALVRAAHAKKVQVFFSIGGGNPPHHLADLVKPAKRDSFAAEIARFAKQYSFDGVDIDLENALIDEHYPSFVKSVSRELKGNGKVMTAALASWNAGLIPDSTLHLYDFINIMSYDKTGPWNKAKAGPHSPHEMATNDFQYFKGRGISPAKLIVGLPFYGYGFGAGAPESMNYGDIISTFPGAELKDSLQVKEGGWLYYNGSKTIREKTSFAIKNGAAGVMIWQIFGDAVGDQSLLKHIGQSIQDNAR